MTWNRRPRVQFPLDHNSSLNVDNDNLNWYDWKTVIKFDSSLPRSKAHMSISHQPQQAFREPNRTKPCCYLCTTQIHDREASNIVISHGKNSINSSRLLRCDTISIVHTWWSNVGARWEGIRGCRRTGCRWVIQPPKARWLSKTPRRIGTHKAYECWVMGRGNTQLSRYSRGVVRMSMRWLCGIFAYKGRRVIYVYPQLVMWLFTHKLDPLTHYPF